MDNRVKKIGLLSIGLIVASVGITILLYPQRPKVKVLRIQSNNDGEYRIDTSFTDLPKSTKFSYNRSILYTKTEDGWITAPSHAAGDVGGPAIFWLGDFTPIFELAGTLEKELTFPNGETEIKILDGINPDGDRVAFYIGYGADTEDIPDNHPLVPDELVVPSE